MGREYDPLPIRELGAGAGFCRPMQPLAERVSLESPAFQVMTDLTRTAPATIRPEAPLPGANRYMIARGVRLLLVVDEGEGVLGLLTAADILGERPMQVGRERGLGVGELAVADVMTPAARIEVIALETVQSARVGHVVETLRRLGRQHALVIDGARRVRGIFSATQIARQLGVPFPSAGEVARTFAEIEAALAR